MKIADFFVKVGVVGDTKKLDKTIKQLETLSKRQKEVQIYRKNLAKATTEEERAQVKKNFADKVRIENLKKEKAGLEANKAALMGAVKGITAFVGAAVVAYNVVDRMIGSLARANQQLMTFQRTSGISFSSLNKYASANAAVNYNSTIEGTAQSMQRVAQNLWDIRMGRGDISPYQELAYVGGKAFNPMGMSVEQVIESVRESIKGVNDLQATNIITRMGFAPDDLLMLRMSREEFEKINSMFLNREQREAINAYALQLKKVQLEFNLLKEKALLKLMPLFIKLTTWLKDTISFWVEVGKVINDAINASEGFKTALISLGVIFTGLLVAAHPLIAGLTLLYLILEDIAYAIMGYDSITGLVFKELGAIGETLSNSFNVEGIKDFFKAIKEGIAELSSIKPAEWVLSFLGGNPLRALELNILKKFILTRQNNGFDSDFTPKTSLSSISNATSNENNWNVSIATNQPMSTVINDLNNFGFTQATYAGATA